MFQLHASDTTLGKWNDTFLWPILGPKMGLPPFLELFLKHFGKRLLENAFGTAGDCSLGGPDENKVKEGAEQSWGMKIPENKAKSPAMSKLDG